ncbi:MAG: FtsX-like permease family protein [Ornithinimicrobium sp.]
MTSFVLMMHRARAGIGLLLTITALVTAATAIIAGTVGYSRAAATVAARDALTVTEDPTEAGLRVRTRQLTVASTQDDTAREIIAEAFAPAPVLVQQTLASEPRPVTDRDEKLQVIAGASLQPEDSEFRSIVEVRGGQWPRTGGATTEGALHTGAAATWNLDIGDTLDVGGRVVEITATWRPIDPNAPLWFGDRLAAGGTDDMVGPLIVSPGDISRFSDPPFVHWIVLPNADQLLPEDLDALADAAATLKPQLDTDEVASRGITVMGDLAPTAARAAQHLATARALNVVPLILLFSVCVIAVLQLARLLAAARTSELETFLARGASRRQVVGWTSIESTAVAGVGTALGIAVALGVLRTVPAGSAQTALVLGIGSLTGAAVLVALVLVTVVQVRDVAAVRTSDRSGRARAVATVSTVVLVLGAAALAWWQLHRHSSPLVTGAGGAPRTDLLAGAAPTLLLGATAVIAVALLGPIARLLERLLSGVSNAATHLSAAQVSRRLLAYAVPVVLLVLAGGATTLSGLYAGTSADLRTRLSALGQGAEVRATLAARPDAGQAGRIATEPPVAGLPGVEGAAPVWLANTDIADSDAELVIAPMASLAEVAIVPQGAADPGALGGVLAVETSRPGAIELTGGTSIEVEVALGAEISVDDQDVLAEELASQTAYLERQLDVTPAKALEQATIDLFGVTGSEKLQVSLLVQERDTGVLQRVAAGSVPFGVRGQREEAGQVGIEVQSGTNSVPVQVPDGVAFDVVGVDIDRRRPYVGLDYTVDVAIVSAGERQPDARAAKSWQVSVSRDAPEHVGAPGPAAPTLQPGPEGGLRVTATTEGGFAAADPNSKIALRAMTSAWAQGSDTTTGSRDADVTGEVNGTGAVGETARIPIALTAPLASANNLDVGSPIDLTVYGTEVSADVVAVVEAVPGTASPNVALLDSRSLSAAMLTKDEVLPDPTQLWVRGADPSDIAEAVSQVDGIVSANAATPVPVTDAAAAVRLVFWVASAGSLLLAATGVAAVAATLLAGRRPEVAVLRALGMPPGAQARSRAAELAGIVVAALGVGLLGGWLVGWAVVPELARSTTAPGQASLPAPLQLEAGPWSALLAATTVVIAVILAVLARLVRAQAGDTTYREEIR